MSAFQTPQPSLLLQFRGKELEGYNYSGLRDDMPLYVTVFQTPCFFCESWRAQIPALLQFNMKTAHILKPRSEIRILPVVLVVDEHHCYGLWDAKMDGHIAHIVRIDDIKHIDETQHIAYIKDLVQQIPCLPCFRLTAVFTQVTPSKTAVFELELQSKKAEFFFWREYDLLNLEERNIIHWRWLAADIGVAGKMGAHPRYWIIDIIHKRKLSPSYHAPGPLEGLPAELSRNASRPWELFHPITAIGVLRIMWLEHKAACGCSGECCPWDVLHVADPHSDPPATH